MITFTVWKSLILYRPRSTWLWTTLLEIRVPNGYQMSPQGATWCQYGAKGFQNMCKGANSKWGCQKAPLFKERVPKRCHISRQGDTRCQKGAIFHVKVTQGAKKVPYFTSRWHKVPKRCHISRQGDTRCQKGAKGVHIFVQGCQIKLRVPKSTIQYG